MEMVLLDLVSALTYDWVQHSAGGLAPHAVCLLLEPAVIVNEVVTNLGIAAAYFLIPFAILRFLKGAHGVMPFRSVLVMFFVFILSCGLGHLTHLVTLFVGGWAYWLHAGVMQVTMVASIGTALGLLRHGRAIGSLAVRLAQSRPA